MSQRNLITELGRGYVSEYFQGAFFNFNGNLYKFRSVDHESAVNVYHYTIIDRTYRRSTAQLPSSVLESFETFAWPKLGYRNQLLGDGTNSAVYLRSARSVRRGLSQEMLEMDHPRAVEILLQAGVVGQDFERCMVSAFRPTWFTNAEAIAMLKSHKAVAVALNEDLCLSYNLDNPGAESAFELLFKGRVVGKVSQSGELMLSNKGINKTRMIKLLNR